MQMPSLIGLVLSMLKQYKSTYLYQIHPWDECFDLLDKCNFLCSVELGEFYSEKGLYHLRGCLFFLLFLKDKIHTYERLKQDVLAFHKYNSPAE